jgi:asparagine synthase (glutamine-hydrolysing)
MCGIAGLLRGRDRDVDGEATVARMTDAIAHRGPDDSGRWLDGGCGVALGHRRLSILDLTPEGHQPMHSATSRFVIVYNGEVYNFKELRAALEGAGARFRGTSDTEVILAAIEAWGLRDAVRRLNGIFAFAIWDRREAQLTLVRDHLGVKPLYYGWVNGQFAFGSELAAIRRVPGFAAEVNRDALALLLRYNCIPAPHSIYRGVFKLPPGSLLTLPARPAEGDERVEPYWSLREVAEHGLAHPIEADERGATDVLEDVLRRAVGQQMVSDVPLGAFLSGGVDSSVVVALMQAQSRERVKTFSLGFREAAYDESAHAARVAAHLGTDHTEMIVTPADAQAVIPLLPTIYDEPFADSSQIPTYLVSKLARERVTVSLSGDGGDELFAGYNRHVMGEPTWNRIRRVPGPLRTAMAGVVSSISPAAWDGGLALARRAAPRLVRRTKLGYHAHKLASLFSAREPLDIYRRLVSHWDRPSDVVLGAREPMTAAFDRSRAPLGRLAEEMMALDMVTYLPDDILVKVDRASMAVGLEARVPLLDLDVVQFAWRIPLALKLRDGRGKHLLREVLYRHVPRELIDRPKAGFGVPIDAWLRGPLRPWAEDLLDPTRLRQEGYIDAAAVRAVWDAHQAGRVDAQYMLWDVLMFQAWLRHG